LEITIRNPNAHQHFMVVRSIAKKVVIRLPSGRKLAESSRAVRILESGKSLYDPVVYVPMDDIIVSLTEQPNISKCPLKGTASYFTYRSEGEIYENLAWSYRELYEFSNFLKGLVAFYPDRVIIEEHPMETKPEQAKQI
jgi:uncharacterized protein (DUF427 family)